MFKGKYFFIYHIFIFEMGLLFFLYRVFIFLCWKCRFFCHLEFSSNLQNTHHGAKFCYTIKLMINHPSEHFFFANFSVERLRSEKLKLFLTFLNKIESAFFKILAWGDYHEEYGIW